jgi:hypothetical protein
MFKRMNRYSIMVLIAAILAGGNAHAGKLYAVSAEAEPSNAVLYRYDITGPNDHRCEAIDPSTGWSQPELFLPILPSEVQQTSPLSGGWPQRSPGALTVSPWGEMFVFDRGYGGNGAGATHRFLDPTGPSPQYNGTIDARSLGLNSDFRTFHWGSFRDNELYVAERYGVVTRILFDQNHTASYNGQIPVYPGQDSTRSAQVTPWGEVFVGFAYNYGPLNRYLIEPSGAAVSNGVLGGTVDCSFWGIHDMVFSPSGDMFITSGMSSIVRVRFDASRNATCSVVAADARLGSTIAVAYAPWGELFVSNHLRNEVTRWLDSGNGPLTYNGTIYTPVGPVAGFWGPVDGIGDIEFIPGNNLPVANAGPDQTVEMTSCTGASVTLNGAASSDTDGDPLTYTWTENSVAIATGMNPTVILAYGTHTITLTVDDGKGGTATDGVVVTIVDTTAPVLTLTVSPNTLWPPNHQYVTVTPTIAVTDACAATTTVKLLTVTSNEPDYGLGDSDMPNDIVINMDGTISLRAERSSKGTGRVYTITYQAVDIGGNRVTATARVTVPHNL